MAGAVSLGTLSVRILADTSAVEKGFGTVIKKLSLAAGASLTVAIAQGIGDGLRNSAQLNASLARIQTLTSDAFNAKQVRDFSNALGVDAVQSAEAVYTALSSGAKNVVEAQNEVAAAAKLSRATNADLNSTVAAVTAGYNAYAASGISAADASDILFTIQKDGVGTMDALTSAIGQVLPSAANLGVSFKEIGADLAASTLTGKSYANAATGLKVVLQELGNSTSKVSGIFKEATGKSITDFIAKGGTLNEVLATIVKTVGKGGLDETFHAKGSAAAVKQLLVSMQGVDTATKDMAKSAGSVDTAFGVVDKSLSGQLNDLKVKLQNAFGSLGDTVLPGLVAQASGLFDDLTNAAKNIEPTLQAVGGDFMAISNALTPLLPSLSTVIDFMSRMAPAIAAVVSGLIAYWTYVKLAAAATALWELATTVAAFIELAAGVRSAAGAMALLDVALDANPIGITIAAVAALAAGFVYLWQTSEKFRNIVVAGLNGVKDVVIDFVQVSANLFLDYFDLIISGAAHAFGWVPGLGSKLKEANRAFDSFKDGVNNTLNALKDRDIKINGDASGFIQAVRDATKAYNAAGFQGPALPANFPSGVHTSTGVSGSSDTFGGGGGGGIGTPAGASKASSAVNKVADALKKIKDELGQLAQASTMSKDQIDSLFKTLAADTKDALSGKAEAAALKMEKTWNKSLDSMATHLATLHDKVNSELQFGAQVKQTVRDLGSVASATEGISQTFFGVQNHLRAAVAQSNQFYQVFKKLEAMGLNDVSLSQLAAAGPASLGDAQAILSGGQQGISGKGGINDLQGQLDTAANKIANKTADNYYSAGQSVSQGFLDGIKSKEKDLEAQMDKLGKKAAEAIKKALGIHSPSRVMHGVGNYVAQGLADGITAGGKKVSSASAGMAGQVIFGAGSVVVSANGREPMEAGTMAGKGLTSVLERQRAQAALRGLR